MNVYTKVIKIGSFLTQLSKNIVILFWNIVRSSTPDEIMSLQQLLFHPSQYVRTKFSCVIKYISKGRAEWWKYKRNILRNRIPILHVLLTLLLLLFFNFASIFTEEYCCVLGLFMIWAHSLFLHYCVHCLFVFTVSDSTCLV